MTYKRKTRDVFILQQHWGNQYGWEDITEEETRKAAIEQLKVYRENQPDTPARIITRREKIENINPLFIGVYPEGIVYADRTQEEHGDYKKLAFLDYSTLKLTINDDCPAALREQIESHAAKMKSGDKFQIDSCGSFVILGGGKL